MAKEKDTKNKKSEKKTGSFLAEHRAELRKVTWPTRQELVKETVTVIVLSLIIGVIIFAMDQVLMFGYNKLSSLGGGSTNTVVAPAEFSSDALPEGVEVVTTDGTEGIEIETSVEGETSAADEAGEAPEENVEEDNAASEDSESVTE